MAFAVMTALSGRRDGHGSGKGVRRSASDAGSVKAAGLPFTQRIPQPVYSAGTRRNAAGGGNFNLVTFATPASLGSPLPAHVGVGFYVGTASWEAVKRDGVFLLQLLGREQASLWRILGQTSAKDAEVDKIASVEGLGESVGWVDAARHGVVLPYMKGCIGYFVLEVENWVLCGDHEWAMSKVHDWAECSSEDEVLTTEYLRSSWGLGAPGPPSDKN